MNYIAEIKKLLGLKKNVTFSENTVCLKPYSRDSFAHPQ
jgi:hypothetical protein